MKIIVSVDRGGPHRPAKPPFFNKADIRGCRNYAAYPHTLTGGRPVLRECHCAGAGALLVCLALATSHYRCQQRLHFYWRRAKVPPR